MYGHPQSSKDAEIMWGPHRIAIFSRGPRYPYGILPDSVDGGLYLPYVISTSDSPWRAERLSQWRCDVQHCHTQRVQTFHWPALQVHRHGNLSHSPEWSEKEHTRERNPPLPIGSLCLWLWLLVLSATFFERPDLPRSHGFVNATLISLFAISAVQRSHTNRKGWLFTIYLRMGSNTPVSRRMYIFKSGSTLKWLVIMFFFLHTCRFSSIWTAGFSTFNVVCVCICADAVRRLHIGATDSEMREVVTTWLTGSRDNGKREREEAKRARQAEDSLRFKKKTFLCIVY